MKLPTAREPVGVFENYDFPTDTAKLTNAELGNLRLKLTVWHGHCNKLVGDLSAEIHAIKSVFGSALAARVSEMQKTAISKSDKETRNHLAINSYPDLARMHRGLIVRETKLIPLKTQLEIYTTHINGLTGEQARRNAESRI